MIGESGFAAALLEPCDRAAQLFAAAAAGRQAGAIGQPHLVGPVGLRPYLANAIEVAARSGSSAASPRSAISLSVASVTVLDGRELEARNVVTVIGALRSVPGLAVSQSGSYGSTASVFFRGGESNHVGVLIDGVQVNDPAVQFRQGHRLPKGQIG